MLLSHSVIEQYVDEGRIIIKPNFNKSDIRPVGIRLHLAKDILIPEPGQTAELGQKHVLRYREVDLETEDFYLEPNMFILAATEEAIQTPSDVVAILDGRSTMARLGIAIHATASVIDGTFEQPHVAVLEIKNVGNFRVRLKFRDPIGMMSFARLEGEVTQKIQTQYGGGQSRVTPPNLDFRTGQDN